MLYFYEHMNNNNNNKMDSVKLLLFNQMRLQSYLLEKTGVLIVIFVYYSITNNWINSLLCYLPISFNYWFV